METLEIHKLENISPEAADFLPLNGTDYLELYVGNARQSAHYFQSAFGFQPLAHAGLETGLRDRESYVLVQDKIRLVLTSPLHDGTEIGRHIDKHGDGVRVVALWVDDATKAFEETTSRSPPAGGFEANAGRRRARLCCPFRYPNLWRYRAYFC